MIVILEFSLYKIEAFLGEKFQGPNGCNWDLGFLGLVSVLSEQCYRFSEIETGSLYCCILSIRER